MQSLRQTGEQIQQLLQPLGLSHKEMTVFLTMMQYASQSVVSLARICKFPRTTIYSVLERLQEQGLVRVTHSGTSTNYASLSFDELLHYIDLKAQNMSSFRVKLDESKQLFADWQLGQSSAPIISFCKKDEIPVMMYDKILSTDYVDAIWDMQATMQYFGVSVEKVMNYARISTVLTRRIIIDSELGREYKKLHESDRYQIRILAAEQGQYSDYMLFDDTVYHISYSNPLQPLGMIIQDRSYFTLQKAMFEQLWNGLQ